MNPRITTRQRRESSNTFPCVDKPLSKRMRIIFAVVAAILFIPIGYLAYHSRVKPQTYIKDAPAIANEKQAFESINTDSNNKTVIASLEFRYPSSSEGASLRYEDRVTMYETPIRLFNDGITVAYKSYFKESNQQPEEVITVLLDRDSAFVSFYSMELGPSGNWKTIQAHIGCFAQDGCSNANELFYFLESNSVFAVVGDAALLSDVFSNSECHIDTSKSSTKLYDGKQYQDQMKCISKYFSSNENQHKLRGNTFEQIKNLRFE